MFDLSFMIKPCIDALPWRSFPSIICRTANEEPVMLYLSQRLRSSEDVSKGLAVKRVDYSKMKRSSHLIICESQMSNEMKWWQRTNFLNSALIIIHALWCTINPNKMDNDIIKIKPILAGKTFATSAKISQRPYSSEEERSLKPMNRQSVSPSNSLWLDEYEGQRRIFHDIPKSGSPSRISCDLHMQEHPHWHYASVNMK